MANQNFEKLLEYIVNGEQEKAEELFHTLVVGKSREIYEGLFEEEMKDVDIDEAKKDDDEEMEEAAKCDDDDMEEESVEEAFIAFSEEPMGGDVGDEFVSDISANAGDDDSMDMDIDAGDEDEMGSEGEIEDRVMDLEDALDDLKAEFEKLMADEEGEPEHHDGENDPDFGDEEEEGEEEGEEEEEEADESFNFEDIEDIDLSPTEQMREYVEKVTKGVLGSSEEAGVNKKSIVASKNDMGGTTENMMRQDQGSTKGSTGGLLNPTTKEDNAKNVNVPGGKAGIKHLKNVPAGHGAEKSGSKDSAPNKKSIIGSKG